MLQLLSDSQEESRVAASRVLGVALKFNADDAFQSSCTDAVWRWAKCCATTRSDAEPSTPR